MLEGHFINHNTFVVCLCYFMYFGNKSSKLLLSRQYIALMLLFNLTLTFTFSYVLREISLLRYIVKYFAYIFISSFYMLPGL